MIVCRDTESSCLTHSPRMNHGTHYICMRCVFWLTWLKYLSLHTKGMLYDRKSCSMFCDVILSLLQCFLTHYHHTISFIPNRGGDGESIGKIHIRENKLPIRWISFMCQKAVAPWNLSDNRTIFVLSTIFLPWVPTPHKSFTLTMTALYYFYRSLM